MIVTQLWSFLNHEILTLFLPQLCLCTSVLCVMMKNIFVWFPYSNHNIKSHKGGNEGIISGLEQEKERETNVCWLDEEAIMCGKCTHSTWTRLSAGTERVLTEIIPLVCQHQLQLHQLQLSEKLIIYQISNIFGSYCHWYTHKHKIFHFR